MVAGYVGKTHLYNDKIPENPATIQVQRIKWDKIIF
jgi:hypothetical protein